MPLSWNEIKDSTLKFSKEWKDTTIEKTDTKPFFDDFFDVFGITPKKIETFEHRVKKLSDANGYIDLLWKGTILVEMKSDFQYSASILYNNYPWPENPSDKQIKIIEEKAQNVLDVRASFPNSSLADLYNPLTMPPALVKAHNELDKAVDVTYSKQAFTSEAKRMEFLFELYEKYTAGLFVKEKKGKKINN